MPPHSEAPPRLASPAPADTLPTPGTEAGSLHSSAAGVKEPEAQVKPPVQGREQSVPFRSVRHFILSLVLKHMLGSIRPLARSCGEDKSDQGISPTSGSSWSSVSMWGRGHRFREAELRGARTGVQSRPGPARTWAHACEDDLSGGSRLAAPVFPPHFCCVTLDTSLLSLLGLWGDQERRCRHQTQGFSPRGAGEEAPCPTHRPSPGDDQVPA